ncbi:MAG: flagellar export chaperone FlgN [Enterovibrio sp.]
MNSTKMNHFDQLLNEQATNVTTLLNLLKEEAVVIAKRDTPAIEMCAKKKIKLVQAIEQRDEELAKLTQTQTPNEPQLEIISLVNQQLTLCHQQNNNNGILLQRAAMSINKLRNLFNDTINKNEIIYDSAGHTSGRRTLGTKVKA